MHCGRCVFLDNKKPASPRIGEPRKWVNSQLKTKGEPAARIPEAPNATVAVATALGSPASTEAARVVRR